MQTGKLLRQPVNLIERFVGGNSRGIFSPEGGKLAYVSERGGRNRHVIVIRSLATGEERDLPRRLDLAWRLSWQRDGARLRVGGRDLNGRYGVYGVDEATGETKLIVANQPDMGHAVWTPDGKGILHRNHQAEGPSLHFYSLADGSVRTVPGKFGGYSFSLSPDGRWIATIDESKEIRVHPAEGGDGRVLASAEEGRRFGRWTVWTPDGKALLVLEGASGEGNDPWTLWIVPVDGSTPIETELRHKLANAGAWPLRIHPDGKTVVYGAGGSFRQFWALHDLTFE